MVTLGATMFAAFGEVAIIAAVTDFAVYVVFLAVNATVIVLRRTCPELPRPFAVGGTVGAVPVLRTLALAAVSLMMAQLQPVAILIGAVACASGIALGRLIRSKH